MLPVIKNLTTSRKMAMQEQQIAKGVDAMKLDGDKNNEELKKMRKMMKNMVKKSYGMQEDELYAVPFEVSRGSVDKYQVRYTKEIDAIHVKMVAMMKMIATVKRDIEENQKTKYRLLVMKKRNKTNDAVQASKKKRKFDDMKEKIERRKEDYERLNTTPSLEALDSVDDDDEEDEMDLR
jgi:hypothetical protein